MMQCSSTWFACSWKFDVDNVFYQVLAKKSYLSVPWSNPSVIYPDFHSTKRALWLVDSWLHAPDQIQMYPDQDTIAQLLPVRRIQQHVFAIWLFKGKFKYITKHLMYGPSRN